ncbi:hypothetical protein BDW74DRAFT_184064 [Aspergillus multicolor]|uniref:nuclear transport factor 2 family protein n=1 Tax=Aspergillus multicolor TaxID=41759 RepID=UPI003CCCC6FD
MASTPAHTARSILQTFYTAETAYMSLPPESRSFASIAAIMAPDFELHQTPALPYGGIYHGPQGMEDWMKVMAGYFDIVDMQDPEIFEKEGSDRVVVLGTAHLRVRKTGEELHMPITQVVRVDLERGLLVELRPAFWDVERVCRALGHEPSKEKKA